jgi:hypothetical protein
MQSRRDFLKKILMAGGAVAVGQKSFAKPVTRKKEADEVLSTVYRAVNGMPGENLVKVIEMLGGIQRIIGRQDVVVIKANVMWWNQGAPNLSALSTFVDLVLTRPGGFNGEIVLAENCHRGVSPRTASLSGWNRRFERNSNVHNAQNYNELSRYLKRKWKDRFSTSHWIDVGAGGRRVFGPADGNGYVYCDGSGGVPLITCKNGIAGKGHRITIMTYPIFTTDRGTVVDFKNGVWEKGAYTGQPLRFVNLAAINHHSVYCGATSAIKNYLGISDLSGGQDPNSGRRLSGNYFNFHSFSFDKWNPGPVPGMLGAEIAVFMNTVRKADLNITTGEWVGLASRTDPPVAHTRAVLASTDPVALDYHATKYLLYPNSRASIHNPDDENSPLHQYLVKCTEYGGGIFDERYVGVKSYDFRKKTLQHNDELVVIDEKEWGTNPKMILKYLYLRYFEFDWLSRLLS